MNIYTALQIGDFHLHHCEDYLFVGELGSDKLVCAVMDGCTMGTDSYLASTVTGKLLRKIVKQRNYLQAYVKADLQDSLEDLLKSIVFELFKELADLKNRLLLNQDELLTTMSLLVVNKRTSEGVVLVIGDGVVAINGNITSFDQDNKPDYLGFHLGRDFEGWYAAQHQKIYINSISDVSIATDGIGLFSRFTTQEIPTINPAEFLLNDCTYAEKADMLELKLKELEHQYGLKPGDDLAIVRLRKSEN